MVTSVPWQMDSSRARAESVAEAAALAEVERGPANGSLRPAAERQLEEAARAVEQSDGLLADRD
jgi:hypothetical protein